MTTEASGAAARPSAQDSPPPPRHGDAAGRSWGVSTAQQRHREPVDVHLVLRREGAAGTEVLLSRRACTVYATGLWHAPAVH